MSEAREHLAAALTNLAGGLRASGLYPAGHPGIHTPMRNLASGLAVLMQGRERVRLGLVDEVLVFDEMPFYDAETRFKAVVSCLRERGLESITFLDGIALGELERLVGILVTDDAEESFADAIKKAGLAHVTFRERVDDSDPFARAHATYHDSLGIVIDLMSELRLGRVPSSEGAVRVIDSMREIVLSDESALLGLTLLKKYDGYTYAHSVNVAIFSLAFARHMGLDPALQKKVGLAGLLHDMGKVRMAEAIIKKPGALSDEEMAIMKRHPEMGAEILDQMKNIDRETAEIVLHHHIRYDGTGYPSLPQGAEPHPQGAVVALADCYDALTTTRPYQKSRHPSEAVRVMRRLAGRAYAPEAIASFIDMIGTYPVGELVRLSSNELAVVTALNHVDATSPRLRIVSDRDGRLLENGVDCDLAEETGAGGRVIVAPVDPLTKGIDVAKILGL